MPESSNNNPAEHKQPKEQTQKSDGKKSQGFMESLRLFLQGKKSGKPMPDAEKKEKDAKKVKVGKNAALGLVMSRFAHLSRSGALKKKQVASVKESATTIEATKKINTKKIPLPKVESSTAKKGDIKERTEKRAKKDATSAKDGIGIFNEEADLSLKGNVFDGNDSTEISIPSTTLDNSEDTGGANALPDDYYVDIPESLLKDMEELSSVAQNISTEEIEQAASFLGVFEGGINLEDFAKYSSDPVEGHPKKTKKQKKVTKENQSKDEKDSEETKAEEQEISKEKAAKDSKKIKEKPEKKETKEGGFSMSQFKAFFEQQKKLMAKLTAVANTPLFEPKKFKKLMDALPAITEANKLLEEQKKNGTLPTASKEPGQAGLEGVPSQVQGDSPSPQKQDGSGLIGVNGDVPGDSPVMQVSQGNESVQTGLEGVPDTVVGDGLTPEELANKELKPGGAIESVEETKEVKTKKRSLFGRKPKKESATEIKKNMGIDLSEIAEEKKPKKVNLSALQSEISDEDFLESTTPMTDDTTLASVEGKPAKQPKLSSKEKKALAAQQKENAKEQEIKMAQTAKEKIAQEKAWAAEAKRREKMLAEKRKEREKQEKKMKAQGGKIKVQIPKTKKKKKGFAQFMEGLNYMGMSKERYSFVDNLGVMMDAGLQLLDAIKTQEMEAKNKSLKKLMGKMVVAIETGSPLWRAMESTYFFEDQQVAMIRIGEEAGNLVENLRYLSQQSEKQQELKSKVKTAMIYPIIVFSMLGLIVTGLGMFVLPNLISVIFSLGVPLPLVTRLIVQFTNLFADHGTVLVPSVLGGCFVLMMLHKYTAFKCVTQWVIMKVPGIGVLMKEAVLSQFGVTMGGLLAAGVPVTDALESLANVTTVARYKKFYYLLLQRVRLGDSFATAFTKIKLADKCFPTSMQQLIRTGEKSGSLTKVMGKIAEIHDKRATQVAEKLPVILEPMLLLFIGSLVGTIALGVLAPIYSVVGNVGG